MKTEFLIVANLGLDPCLAVSLIIENLNRINTLKPQGRPKGAMIEYDEICQGSYLNEGDDEDDEDDEKEYSVPGVCFCNEVDLYDTISKLIYNPKIIFLVGYDTLVIREEIIGLFRKDQRVLYTSQLCAAVSVVKLMNKNLNHNKSTKLKLTAAHIFYKEYEEISLDKKYLITKRQRNKAEKIVNYYVNSWSIAYNLFFDDVAYLNKFHHEFLAELIFNDASKFIGDLFSLEAKMEEETKKLIGKEVSQGEGIFLLKTGSQAFFKTEILEDMKNKGYPVSVIEYIKNLEKHIITVDFNQDITYKKGSFQKCELLGKN